MSATTGKRAMQSNKRAKLSIKPGAEASRTNIGIVAGELAQSAYDRGDRYDAVNARFQAGRYRAEAERVFGPLDASQGKLFDESFSHQFCQLSEQTGFAFAKERSPLKLFGNRKPPMKRNDAYSPFAEHLPGGQAVGMGPEDFDPIDLAAGIQDELEEHFGPAATPEQRAFAQEISMDHLAEDPMYYRHKEHTPNAPTDLNDLREEVWLIVDDWLMYPTLSGPGNIEAVEAVAADAGLPPSEIERYGEEYEGDVRARLEEQIDNASQEQLLEYKHRHDAVFGYNNNAGRQYVQAPARGDRLMEREGKLYVVAEYAQDAHGEIKAFWYPTGVRARDYFDAPLPVDGFPARQRQDHYDVDTGYPRPFLIRLLKGGNTKAEFVEVRHVAPPAVRRGVKLSWDSIRGLWMKSSKSTKWKPMVANEGTEKTYRGWRVVRDEGTHIGYRTPTGKRGKGRRVTGWVMHYPEGGSKWVDTFAEAQAYIDEYLGPDLASNATGYYVWPLTRDNKPLVGEGPWGPYPELDGAKTFARIGATEGKHDRAVTVGRDPVSPSFQIVRVYKAGSGARRV